MKKWIYVLAISLAVMVSLNVGADTASADSGKKHTTPITTTSSSNPAWE